MNTAFGESVIGKKVTSFRKATALGQIATLLVVTLAVVAWILGNVMVTVLLLSTLPGIGLIMILGKVQEETN